MSLSEATAASNSEAKATLLKKWREVKAIDEEAVFEINGESHYMPPKSSKYVGKAVSAKSQQEAFSVVENVINNISNKLLINFSMDSKAFFSSTPLILMVKVS